MIPFFQNSKNEIYDHSNPNLSLYGIGRSAIESFDPEILLNPFEEQFYLPTSFVKSSDSFSGKCKVVSQENQSTPLVSSLKLIRRSRLGYKLLDFLPDNRISWSLPSPRDLSTGCEKTRVHWIDLFSLVTKKALVW